jgi:3-oxoacyl-[acyl-carrier protein] reductase
MHTPSGKGMRDGLRAQARPSPRRRPAGSRQPVADCCVTDRAARGCGTGVFDERANLQGKVAIVIGGATGLGGAVSTDLARAGADVALCDIKAEALEATSQAIASDGRLRLSEVLDARDPEALARFFAAFDDVSDRLDIVVNVPGGTRFAMFADSTPESWEEDARSNFVYVLHSCKHAVERMKRSGGGAIVNITAIEAHRAAAGYSVYASYKAALTSFSRSLAVELGRDNIRINTVAMENFRTCQVARIRKALERINPNRAEALNTAGLEMYVPLKRVGRLEEFSNAVLFLASDLSSFTSGTALHVDGGTWASSGWMQWPGDDWLFPRASPRALERLFPRA